MKEKIERKENRNNRKENIFLYVVWYVERKENEELVKLQFSKFKYIILF